MKISVCIATLNGEKYIKEQMLSILDQLGPQDEVIISDDGSTDKTLAVIGSFRDNRIKIIPSRGFASPVFNFENAIMASTGDIIFLSDQDDIWAENKVRRFLNHFQRFDLIMSDCKIIDQKGHVLYHSFFERVGAGPGVIKNLIKNSYSGNCMAFNKRVLKKVLPFPKDIPMHDIWIGFVCDLFYKTYFLPEQLTFFRTHDSNSSPSSSLKSSYSVLRKLMFRVNTLKYFFKVLFR